MKKSIKILLFVILSFFIIAISMVISFFAITSGSKLDEKKLINLNKTVTYYDNNGLILLEEASKNLVTKIADIPDHVKNSFIAIEDKRFYNHNGVDMRALLRAGINNLKTFSFKEGASTISQQLIKNTHLSGEKTLKRKLIELKLSLELERRFSKERILETYLNTIYFGENCYGLTNASKRYFSKTPSELTINESAVLAGLIKAPSNYSPLVDMEKCKIRRNLVLKEMMHQGFISKNEYEKVLEEKIELKLENRKTYDYNYIARKEFGEIIENVRFLGNKFKVYTYCDRNLQEKANELLNSSENEYDKKIVLCDNNSNINVYTSTCEEKMRQLGSTIKPLLVYAPAIETNSVYSCTLVNDEKTNFNGYSPSNYNDKYYGNISVKDSLAKSSNVCAIKILNYTGINNALSYIKKTNIPLTDNDKSLALALGSTEKGCTLTNLLSAYSVFQNEGNYFKAKCIDRIEDENGKILYKNTNIKNKIFSNETVTIVNDMLKNTVQNGTAKKLSCLNFDIYGKTGTVGNKNGNTDAYTISYTSDYLLGVWHGNKDDDLMGNNITGGSLPCSISCNFWNIIYDKKSKPLPIKGSNGVLEVQLDKISYYDNKIELAEEIAPERYKLSTLMKFDTIPKTTSTRFSTPKIEKPILKVNDNGILLQLCQTEYINVKIYRSCDNNKKCIYDTGNEKNKYEFFDNELLPNKCYQYSFVPYYSYKNIIYEGEEIILPLIKMPSKTLGKDWWLNEFD